MTDYELTFDCPKAAEIVIWANSCSTSTTLEAIDVGVCNCAE